MHEVNSQGEYRYALDSLDVRSMINLHKMGMTQDAEDREVLGFLRGALFAMETKEARLKGRQLEIGTLEIENERFCMKCGHIGCTVFHTQT